MSNTVRIVHHSPMGVLDVPLLGREVSPGEVIEVSEQHAVILTRQDLWSLADEKPETAAERKARLAAEKAAAEKAAAEQAASDAGEGEQPSGNDDAANAAGEGE